MRTLFLVLSLMLVQPALAEFSARVDRTSLSTDETLRLTIAIDERVSTGALDYSALQQDFEILSVSSGSQISIINGQQSTRTQWEFTLLPRDEGTLTIPALELNGQRSQAIQVQVSAAAAQGGDQPIQVQVELSDQSIRVNQELVLTVRLLSAPEVSNLSGEQLRLAGADISLLDQNNYNRVIDGRNWRVNEWRYAIYSRTPGTLEIPAQTFSGVVGSGARSYFDPLPRAGQRILARSESRSVEVLPPPADAGNNWLPARDISVEVNWSGNPNQLSVGEPMTRTVVVRARGQQAAALPPITLQGTADYRVYADQPSLEQRSANGTLVSERRDSTAMVPGRDGTITFPEIRIPWWNIETGEWQEAILPPEIIRVAPSARPLPTSPSVPQIDQESDPLTAPVVRTDDPVPWLELGLLALVLVLIGDNWRLRRKRLTSADARHVSQLNLRRPEQRAWRQLLELSQSASPGQIRTLLLRWADLRWPERAPHNLRMLIQQAGPELAAQLRRLEQLNFGGQNTGQELDRSALRSALAAWRDQLSEGESGSAASALPELYPR